MPSRLKKWKIDKYFWEVSPKNILLIMKGKCSKDGNEYYKKRT